MHITILGGAGKMGCIAVKQLAEDSRVSKVVIADINNEQAQLVASLIDNPKIEVLQVDMNEMEAL
jgi:saccharopine dehydrogenase-like NADP-dependent oxidoreductase